MRTEKTLTLLFCFGLILRFGPIIGLNVNLHEFNSLPVAAFSLLLPSFVLSLLYFFGAFYFFCDKEIKKQNLPLSIISGFLLAFIPIGIVMKVVFQEAVAQPLLLMGCITTPIIFIITYAFYVKSLKDLHVYYRTLLIRTGVLGILAILFYFIPIETLIKIRHRKNSQVVIEARIKLAKNPDNKKYEQEYHQLHTLDSLQQLQRKE
jgi:hypothetical protein